MKKTGVFLGILAVLLSVAPPAKAAASVISPLNAGISADTAASGSGPLPVFAFSESAAGEIPAGTLVWAAPEGFVFDTASPANVSYGGNGLSGSAAVTYPDSAHFSLEITATSSAPSSLSVGTATPLKAKAASGTPLKTGSILLSAGSLAGISATTSFGSLTQTPGAPAKLAFVAQPPASAAAGSVFSASVGVQDQFGNSVTADNGRNITLAANFLASSTSGVLAGTLSRPSQSGAAVFSGLSFSAANQISLAASSSGLGSALSLPITIGPASASTTTPYADCRLRNGSLVKVKGSPTVYMAVNCVLRPFTTPAVFHAKGKKFTNIVEIDNQLFLVLGKGRAIGNHDDDEDDDTVIVPGSGSSITALPAVSGLPEGAVVKLPGNPTVYVVSGGQLKPFTSPTVFSLRGKKFGDIKSISQEQFSSLSIGEPVALPEGSLIKGSGQTVYVVEGGKKKGIVSMGVFAKHGWSLKNIVTVSDGEIQAMEDGGSKKD